MHELCRSSGDRGNYAGAERSRARRANQSPADTLRELPALVILERMPIPMLAIGPDGAILLANTAFAVMLGHSQDTIVQLAFHTIFRNLPTYEPVETMRAYADELVELAHCDGSIVRARMSKSAMVRADDNIALAAFHDLTEQLWHDEKR